MSINSHRLFSLTVLFVISTSLNASTAVFNIPGDSKVIGFDGIDIEGESYNVRFVEGDINSLFTGGTTFDFNVYNLSELASQQIGVAISEYESLDSTPYLTSGCTGFTSCSIITPYELGTPYTKVSYFYNSNLEVNDEVRFTSFSTTTDTADLRSTVYADWELASPVPVPAAIWFMGSGLLGLIGLSKRHQL